MNIEQKLQHFYDATVEECRKEAEESVQQHREKLEEELRKHKEFQKSTAEAAVKAETDSALREVKKAISLEELTQKRGKTVHENELEEKLFEEVRTLLAEFKMSGDYEDYLCRRIREALRFAAADEIHIYLSEEDRARIPAVSERVGVPLHVAEKSFLGGMQAILPTRNIRIDNSFRSAIEALGREFKFGGGLKA